ncbi:hypothetical protein MPTK1_2g12700 [Marchantia polymorpha subsp. ruderalis]|uniref:Gnk2-homologous domain-containing protein n=1 Tax=Marchantia polymorpha TaxID=3197 RepID=A0A2R6XAX0_MARPO|nr:hypothetical protein MARPO_0026s0101 [Marchantia polymorpha]BBN02092.1 hypothetical protein Mp_2g12700 [Marchantia polymorpha subsp. ruderalis]|eukprot:PTQ43228.1 hypothetical protein MARPO_0026s0101 [Marchantia polymorpha]
MSWLQERAFFKCIVLLVLFFAICTNAETAGFLEETSSSSQAPRLASSELESSCEMRPLQDSICCLDATFGENLEAHDLLNNLLQNVSGPNYEVFGVPQYLYNSTKSLQVGSKFICDVPLGAEGVPGVGCQKCLQHIVDEIAGGMLSQNGRCRNALAMRFGYIYEPDTPWGEDTTWCHLDYWLKASTPASKVTYSSLSLKITLTWRWNPLLEFGRSVLYKLFPDLL